MIKTILSVAAAALIATGGLYILNADSASPEPSQVPFDHSNCQYPNRESNPPQGCDNSDPAIPECVSPKVISESKCIQEYMARMSESATVQDQPSKTELPETEQKPTAGAGCWQK